MELGLEKKVVLVTGGASGIGGDIVKKLQDLDAIPIVLDRLNKSEATWEQKHISKGGFHWIKLDLTEEDACRDAVQEIVDRFGRIDGLVNNAGVKNSHKVFNRWEANKLTNDTLKNSKHYQ